MRVGGARQCHRGLSHWQRAHARAHVLAWVLTAWRYEAQARQMLERVYGCQTGVHRAPCVVDTGHTATQVDVAHLELDASAEASERGAALCGNIWGQLRVGTLKVPTQSCPRWLIVIRDPT